MGVGRVNLSLKVFGFEIASVELEFGDDDSPAPAPRPVDRMVTAVSKGWFKRMIS